MSILDQICPGQQYARVLLEYEQINATISFIMCLKMEAGAEQEELEGLIDTAMDLCVKTKRVKHTVRGNLVSERTSCLARG